MYKEILFGEEARNKIKKGVNIVADAVASTLGPRGQNVIFEESMFPTITKDGVTVSQQVFLEDKFENMGVMIAREAAENTNREAGDGTTATIVLLRELVNEGHKAIISGMNPILIKRGMDYALDIVVQNLKRQSKEIKTKEERLQIATISANNDKELGSLIVNVLDEVGKDGVVTVTNSNNIKTEVEYVKGTELNSGYQSHVFINNHKRLAVDLKDPVIIICTDDINLPYQLVPLFESILQAGKKNMVLLANNIDGQALAFLIQNYLQGKFNCVPVKIPSFGDYQKDLIYDLATLTNATVLGVEDAKKIEDATIEDCGTVDNVLITRDNTILSGASGDISKRITETKSLLKAEKDIFKKEKLQARLGRLNGSIANIKVGGASEAEQSEIKYRIEDALNATKSAIQEGIVAGGGVALLNCSKISYVYEESESKEFKEGLSIVYKSLLAPLAKIAENSGQSGKAVVSKVLDTGIGYNALTDKYEDLFKAGIIDPVKVVKNEIINAVATSGILLTSNVAIVNKEQKNG